MRRRDENAEADATLPTVLLMLKAPVAGAVKTRLGCEIGMDEAAAIYRRLVERQLREIPPAWTAHVCFAPTDAAAAMRGWLGDRCSFSPQADGDLGARLASAATRHFQRCEAALVIVGGDCPALTAARLREVVAALRTHELVLVPAVDGGYCLIAMRSLCANLFREISWSTAAVLEQTRARIAESGLSCCELQTLEDVDDAVSWRRARTAFPELGQA